MNQIFLNIFSKTAERRCRTCKKWKLASDDIYCGYCGKPVAILDISLSKYVVYFESSGISEELILTIKNEGQTAIQVQEISIEHDWVTIADLPDIPFVIQGEFQKTVKVELNNPIGRDSCDIGIKTNVASKTLTIEVLPQPRLLMQMDGLANKSSGGPMELVQGSSAVAQDYECVIIAAEASTAKTWNCSLEVKDSKLIVESIEATTERNAEIRVSKLQLPTEIDSIGVNTVNFAIEFTLKADASSQTLSNYASGITVKTNFGDFYGQFNVSYKPEPNIIFHNASGDSLCLSNLSVKKDDDVVDALIKIENRGGLDAEISSIQILTSEEYGKWLEPAFEFPMTLGSRQEQQLRFRASVGRFKAELESSGTEKTIKEKLQFSFRCVQYPEYKMADKYLEVSAIVNIMPKYEGVVAIDFGTTNSCVAFVSDDSDDFDQSSKMISFDDEREESNIFPSIIHYLDEKDGCLDYQAGLDVPTVFTHFPDTRPSTVYSIKRELGQKEKVPVTLFNSKRHLEFLPEDIAGHIIQRVIDQAEKSIGRQITECVITHPARFFRPQIKALEHAFMDQCHINKVSLVNEAVAAALDAILNPPFLIDNLSLQKYLDNGQVPEDVRKKLWEKKIALSNNVVVSTEKKDSKWKITDNDSSDTYIIKKEGNALNFYLLDDIEKSEYTIMVYDFGGGTTDIALIMVRQTITRDATGKEIGKIITPEILGVDGVRRLGGDDVTDKLAKIIWDKCRENLKASVSAEKAFILGDPEAKDDTNAAIKNKPDLNEKFRENELILSRSAEEHKKRLATGGGSRVPAMTLSCRIIDEEFESYEFSIEVTEQEMNGEIEESIKEAMNLAKDLINLVNNRKGDKDATGKEIRKIIMPEILGVDGVQRLGGNDVTDKLAKIIWDKCRENLKANVSAEKAFILGDPEAKDDTNAAIKNKPDLNERVRENEFILFRFAEEHKKKLATGGGSRVPAMTLSCIIDEEFESYEFSIEVTEQEMNLAGDLIDLVNNRKGDQEGQLNIQYPDIVMLAGMSSRLPIVRELANEAFPHSTVKLHPDPKACVARGACSLYALSTDPSRVRLDNEKLIAPPPTSADYGIMVRGIHGEPVFETVINKGARLSTNEAKGEVSGFRLGRNFSISAYERGSDINSGTEVKKVAICRGKIPDTVSEEELQNAKVSLQLEDEMNLKIIVNVGNEAYKYDFDIESYM